MNDGKEFEFEVRELLRLMGFDADITGYSQDGGVDIVAMNRSPLIGGRYVVQCKAWDAPVGEPVLRDLFGTMHARGATKGILITTSSFTAAALRFAQGKPLELIDGTQYRELCAQYGVNIYSEIPPDELLQPDSNYVRLIALDCDSAETRSEYQRYVFVVGTLCIGSSFAFKSPSVGGFEFLQNRILKVTYKAEDADSGRPLSQLHVSLSNGLYEPDVYQMVFEGRNALIVSLYNAASAWMDSCASLSARRSTGAGCLFALAIPSSLAGAVWLLWG